MSLHGKVGGQFAPEVLDKVGFNPKKHWWLIQELVRHFRIGGSKSGYPA